MKFVAKAQESRERDANMMMRGFVKIQTAKVLCLRLQCLERIRADVLKFTTGTEGQVNKMSDDLISRKAVLEILYDISCRNYGSLATLGIKKACDVIEHAETIFDKEKVIEQLNGCRVYQFQGMLPDGRVCHFSDVIEIVEKGGIE